MAHRIILFLLLLCLAVSAEAAMVRVVEVTNGRTLVVEANGVRGTIQLSGIQITDEVQARALLQWTLVNSFAMIELRGDAFYVYRSPDGLFINRELVTRGFARATRPDVDPQPAAIVTYLGVLKPTTQQQVADKATGRGKTNSGTRRRSSTGRSRSSPAPKKASSRPSSSD
jgi:endonuclease YncB( thermonuclease family)